MHCIVDLTDTHCAAAIGGSVTYDVRSFYLCLYFLYLYWRPRGLYSFTSSLAVTDARCVFASLSRHQNLPALLVCCFIHVVIFLSFPLSSFLSLKESEIGKPERGESTELRLFYRVKIIERLRLECGSVRSRKHGPGRGCGI